jgi:hypothetical protein
MLWILPVRDGGGAGEWRHRDRPGYGGEQLTCYDGGC